MNRYEDTLDRIESQQSMRAVDWSRLRDAGECIRALASLVSIEQSRSIASAIDTAHKLMND